MVTFNPKIDQSYKQHFCLWLEIGISKLDIILIEFNHQYKKANYFSQYEFKPFFEIEPSP